MRQRSFREDEEVDFLVVGAGAAGGVLAKELSTSGFSVVVLEQGPWRRSEEFQHDELGNWFLNALLGGGPVTFRRAADEEAELRMNPPPLLYAQGVGGSSVHFTGNYWRFRPIDFRERSLIGPIGGTGFADWPITYEELEPYYAKVDWEIGVSGAPGPTDPPRSRPYPLPPLPIKSSGAILEAGARKIGLRAQPAPLAVLSRAYDGRAACMHCGYCMAYGCEFGAKSSTLVSMIPKAMASGNCEIRPECAALRVETDAGDRATGVVYVDAAGAEHRQRAKAVVLAANGAETPRLLLLSESSRFPQGLANGSGLVGRYMMWNAHGETFASFEHPLNEYKSVQVTRIIHDFYETDPRRGFYGGGALDARMIPGPLLFALDYLPPDVPKWGAEYKRHVAELFTHTMEVTAAATSLPLATNTVTLDPHLKDGFGRPALRATYRDHPDDLAMVRFLNGRARALLEAAGAQRIWEVPVTESSIGAHLLGTCRMGDDPRSSVVDRFHRAHEVRNLFICDGSSFVTSGRGQPTMTIQALAFRAAEAMGRFAARGEV